MLIQGQLEMRIDLKYRNKLDPGATALWLLQKINQVPTVQPPIEGTDFLFSGEVAYTSGFDRAFLTKFLEIYETC